MTVIFVICAALGGSVLLIQLAMMLLGFGAEALELDLPEDVGGDMDVDVDVDFDADTGLDTDADVDAHHVDSSWLFGVISFRTVVAAVAFFGLAGLTAQSTGASAPVTLAVAIAGGLAAMFAVYWLMRGLMALRAEGTAHIAGAVGRTGTVYTTIPAEGAGTGKIQLNLQGRTMEYLALTPGHALAPGTKVVVGSVISSDTLEVQAALEETSE